MDHHLVRSGDRQHVEHLVRRLDEGGGDTLDALTLAGAVDGAGQDDGAVDGLRRDIGVGGDATDGVLQRADRRPDAHVEAQDLTARGVEKQGVGCARGQAHQHDSARRLENGVRHGRVRNHHVAGVHRQFDDGRLPAGQAERLHGLGADADAHHLLGGGDAGRRDEAEAENRRGHRFQERVLDRGHPTGTSVTSPFLKTRTVWGPPLSARVVGLMAAPDASCASA